MARRRAGFTMMELVAVLAVIAILALMALPSLQEKVVRDQILEGLPLAEIAKGPVALAWTTTQTFPDNNAAAGLPAADKVVGNYVSATEIQAGAVHITFGNRASNAIKGKILSLRPAVVADAPVVPVAWVCGNAAVPDKMSVKGVNRTNVPDTLLPLKCRP
jgi:type IV pilus assembly protein PilA